MPWRPFRSVGWYSLNRVRCVSVLVSVEHVPVQRHMHDRLTITLAEFGDRDPGRDEGFELGARLGHDLAARIVNRRSAGAGVIVKSRVVR